MDFEGGPSENKATRLLELSLQNVNCIHLVYILAVNFFDEVADVAEISSAEAEQRFGQLDDRTREILAFRWGLEDGVRRTLEECAKKFNTTRERVRQIEQKAFARLRHPKG